MNDSEKLAADARRLLDDEQVRRAPQHARRLQDIRNAALRRADAGAPRYGLNWWMAGAAAVLALVLMLPDMPQPTAVDGAGLAGRSGTLQAQGEAEIAEVLDNLDMLLFFDEEGIEDADADESLDEGLGRSGARAGTGVYT